MILFGRSTNNITLGALAIIAFIAILAFGVNQCAMRKNQGAQSRVDAGQAEAAQGSAKDAIGTVARSGEASAASEQMTRDNERAIRDADGASERVNPAVDYAARAALCRRQAYKDNPKCAIFR